MNEAPMPRTEGGERGTHSTVLSLKSKSDRRFKTDLDEVCVGSLACVVDFERPIKNNHK